jgi:hypothetical protein
MANQNKREVNSVRNNENNQQSDLKDEQGNPTKEVSGVQSSITDRENREGLQQGGKRGASNQGRT